MRLSTGANHNTLWLGEVMMHFDSSRSYLILIPNPDSYRSSSQLTSHLIHTRRILSKQTSALSCFHRGLEIMFLRHHILPRIERDLCSQKTAVSVFFALKNFRICGSFFFCTRASLKMACKRKVTGDSTKPKKRNTSHMSPPWPSG